MSKEEHRWLRNQDSEPNGKQKREESEPIVDKADPDAASGKNESADASEWRVTVPEVQGERLDPLRDVGVLTLVDAAAEVKRLRRLPECFPLKRPMSLVGGGRRAAIKVDDPGVKSEHAAVVFRDGAFWVVPQEGVVVVDGQTAPKRGARLRNGSRVEMGTARFIFLTVVGDEPTVREGANVADTFKTEAE